MWQMYVYKPGGNMMTTAIITNIISCIVIIIKVIRIDYKNRDSINHFISIKVGSSSQRGKKVAEDRINGCLYSKVKIPHFFPTLPPPPALSSSSTSLPLKRKLCPFLPQYLLSIFQQFVLQLAVLAKSLTWNWSIALCVKLFWKWEYEIDLNVKKCEIKQI